ncbi:MAG: NlpC/P60 family protein [Denitromonas halophila]|uniref:NlpC/P60 family protein n=2 Tax=Denitromonas TaxID=139331 RepID=A0A557RWD2_9RHOO|nr:NlpC/P60 family protein [Denitromonas ohlonensis]TVO77571.1 NlpC/P60 family protein [Denitromonas ohlonensis]TVT48454.1 MAG: NlpC/P60 family protein [Denitromonas halophila]TVT66572.1 MAG: NlpC/P60 family protein [Denitromonas halophila]TVT74089.1 MAG: NlpC/P60 family protein [Denitromonas halophila]
MPGGAVNRSAIFAAVAAVLVLHGCSTVVSTPPTARTVPGQIIDQAPQVQLNNPADAEQIVLFSYGLLGTGYRFGGRNPEAGLDCSGMVSYVVEQVSGVRLPHNAARIAAQTRVIATDSLQPGDLVFFNTQNRPYSHMGIYLGDGKFIHAPSSKGKVRVEKMNNRYFAQRFDGARSLFSDG